MVNIFEPVAIRRIYIHNIAKQQGFHLRKNDTKTSGQWRKNSAFKTVLTSNNNLMFGYKPRELRVVSLSPVFFSAFPLKPPYPDSIPWHIFAEFTGKSDWRFFKKVLYKRPRNIRRHCKIIYNNKTMVI